jgi:hypothetical protein
MRRKTSQDHDHADGPLGSAPGIKEISETHSRDAAKREHLLAPASEAGRKAARRQPGARQPSASNVVMMADADTCWKGTDPKNEPADNEPTAVDIAGSMFVASAELVLSTLEELKVHVRALRTKEEVEAVLTARIERWKEAVIQFRVERSRKLPVGK